MKVAELEANHLSACVWPFFDALVGDEVIQCQVRYKSMIMNYKQKIMLSALLC